VSRTPQAELLVPLRPYLWGDGCKKRTFWTAPGFHLLFILPVYDERSIALFVVTGHLNLFRLKPDQKGIRNIEWPKLMRRSKSRLPR
jgi:hypothetical protein